MTTMRCHSLGRRLSLALIGLMLVGIIAPPGVGISTKADAQENIKTVLAFPAVDESPEGNLGDVAHRLTSRLALAGVEIKQLDLEVFSETSPMVRRSIADGALRRADVEGPKDAYAAVLIGRAIGVDSVVLVSVQKVTVSGDPRAAEVSVMGAEYDVAANVDAGEVADEPTGNTFGVSGTAKTKDRTAGDDGALIRLAARDAAYKVLSVLSGQSADVFEKEGAKPKKRSDKWKWIAVGLLAIGLIAATSGGSSAPNPVVVDSHLPTSLTINTNPPDSIRLRWIRPTTADPILNYEIQRSSNNGAFIRIDNASVGATATEFLDVQVTAGTTYVYRMRVLYTTGYRTEWVTFVQTSL